MSDWQDSPTMQAAALEGVSENLAYPLADRLKAAQQAVELLRGHIDVTKGDCAERRWATSIIGRRCLDCGTERDERPPVTLETLLANATVVRVEPGGVLLIGGVGRMGEHWDYLKPELDALKASTGASKIWLFEEAIDAEALPAEIAERLARQDALHEAHYRIIELWASAQGAQLPNEVIGRVLAQAQDDPAVAEALDGFVRWYSRINGGGASEVLS